MAAGNTAFMTTSRLYQPGVISGNLNLSRDLVLITGASLLGNIFALASASTNILQPLSSSPAITIAARESESSAARRSPHPLSSPPKPVEQYLISGFRDHSPPDLGQFPSVLGVCAAESPSQSCHRRRATLRKRLILLNRRPLINYVEHVPTMTGSKHYSGPNPGSHPQGKHTIQKPDKPVIVHVTVATELLPRQSVPCNLSNSPLTALSNNAGTTALSCTLP